MGNFHPTLPEPSPDFCLKPEPFLQLLAGSAACLLAAWIPVRFLATEERILFAAGLGTPALTESSASLLNSEHLGAGLRLALLAKSLSLPESDSVLQSGRTILSSRRDLAYLGTRDSRLELILATSGIAFENAPNAPPPVLTVLLREPVRIRLKDNLRANPSPGVQSLLESMSLSPLPPFLAAGQAGGQPLEACTLLTAHLLDTGAFSPSLAGEIKAATQTSLRENSLRALQPTLLDILSLARRYDYDSLLQLLPSIPSLPALTWTAEQIRSSAEPADLFLAAAFWGASVDRLAKLPLPQKNPWRDLSQAVTAGKGAVDLLVQRPFPVLRIFSPFPPTWTPTFLRWEKWLLLARGLLLVLGSWLCVGAVWRLLPDLRPSDPGPWRPVPRLAQTLLLALFLGSLMEPSFLQPHRLPRYRLSLADPPSSIKINHRSKTSMDTTNLITLAVFLGLQIAVYRICVRRIRQIEEGPGDANLKLRLLENEDNLFDSGLYVGIGGTATALVLQVLGIIQPSLLAAYSSNLFGIACVALVKIFHVRALKQRLILPPSKS